MIDKDKGYRKALRQLRAMSGKKVVVVGIRGEKGSARAEGDNLTLVEIAAVNEFGTYDGHIPERSFLRSTFDKNKSNYERLIVQAVEKVAKGIGHDGQPTDLDKELESLGVKAARDVVETINAGVPPPNAPSTSRRKRGSEGTLRNTGRLRHSIDSEVRVEP